MPAARNPAAAALLACAALPALLLCPHQCRAQAAAVIEDSGHIATLDDVAPRRHSPAAAAPHRARKPAPPAAPPPPPLAAGPQLIRHVPPPVVTLDPGSDAVPAAPHRAVPVVTLAPAAPPPPLQATASN